MKIRPFLYSLLALAACAPPGRLEAQLFDNLMSLSNRTKVGNPRWDQPTQTYLNENPKGLATGDFDGDSHPDWAVSRLDGKILISWGLGNGKFMPPAPWPTPAGSFRQLIAADLNGDGKLDLAAADPFQGKIYILFKTTGRSFSAPQALVTWEGARNMVAGDFDGDGVTDLAVGGSDKEVTLNFEKPWEPLPAPPASVQPTNGVRLYRGTGGGQFTAAGNLPTLATKSTPWEDDDDAFPRPVYVMKSWRPAGQTKDWLVVTHALASTVWILTTDTQGAPAISSTISTGLDGVRAAVIGKVTAGPLPDLILASRDLGTVQVRQGTADGLGFQAAISQTLDIPGGPRALEVADLDADGWRELVVVARNTNLLTTFRNNDGVLVPSSTAVTGRSPRELSSADFDHDGRKDFVVLNRDSADVSVLIASAASGPGQPPRTGFAALDQTYTVEGDVAQIGLLDLNGDGRAEVIQLHHHLVRLLGQPVSPSPALVGPPVARQFTPGSGGTLPVPVAATTAADFSWVLNGRPVFTSGTDEWPVWAATAALAGQGEVTVTDGPATLVVPFDLRISPPSPGARPQQRLVAPGLPKAMPNQGLATATVTAPALTIDEVRVLLDLQHHDTNDLVIDLVSPDGLTVRLVDPDVPASIRRGRNFDRTLFAQDAPDRINDAAAPFAGTFRPSAPLPGLAAFAGPRPAGDWTLRIEDLRTDSNTGTLRAFVLQLLSPAPAPSAAAFASLVPPPGAPPACELLPGPAFRLLHWAPPPGKTLRYQSSENLSLWSDLPSAQVTTVRRFPDQLFQATLTPAAPLPAAVYFRAIAE